MVLLTKTMNFFYNNFYIWVKYKKAKNLKTYDNHIISEIQNGRDKTLRLLYRNFRQDFIVWAKRKFNLDESILEDAFQDALEIFYRNVISGKLTTLNAPLKNYLAGIGRLKLLQYLDKNKRIDYPDNINEEQIKSIDNFLDTIVETELDIEKKLHLKNGFNKLSKTYQTLLTKRYYEEKSIETITNEMNYDNTNTTRAAISRCLKQLKNLLS
jgi:RNA polymerase sigma factor (sigma-70 family)